MYVAAKRPRGTLGRSGCHGVSEALAAVTVVYVRFTEGISLNPRYHSAGDLLRRENNLSVYPLLSGSPWAVFFPGTY